MKPAASIVLGLAACLALGERLASVTQADDAIDSARKALTSQADFPWYDAVQDTIQRVDVYPPKDVAGRKSSWQPTTRNWPEWLINLVKVGGWGLFALALLVAIWVLARSFVSVSGQRRGGANELDENGRAKGDIDRIEALPFQLQGPQTDLLAQARRHYAAGEYGQAIIYFYSYQLIQLDRLQLIRLTKGKTNRQYLRELRSRREFWDHLSQTMVLFEDVFFGDHVLDRERFESCWQRLDDFHQDLARAAG